MRTHLFHEPDAAHLEMLRAIVPTISCGAALPEAVDVLVHGLPSDDDLARLSHGGALIIPYSGLPGQTRERLGARPDLAVYNLHHNAQLVAEHAMGLLLAASRQIVRIDRAHRSGDWRPRYDPDDSPCLRGGVALVLGYGAIGRLVCPALQGLGMEVVAVRRRAHHAVAGVRVVGLEALDAWLPKANALLVALPLTPQTEGLLDATRLARLPRHCVLVNVARAAICDEAALYEALRSRQLYAAGLDVWWRMPGSGEREHTPPSTWPFHELDNVVLSPHRAGHAANTEELRMRALAAVLADLAEGRAPSSRVDLGAGY